MNTTTPRGVSRRRLSCTLFIALCLFSTASGCIIIGGGPELEEAEGQEVSFRGTVTQFERGVANIAFSWLEIPKGIASNLKGDRFSSAFSVISYGVDTVGGAAGSAFDVLKRATGGAVEILISPFPPYDPIMTPPYPPYMVTRKKLEEEIEEEHEDEEREEEHEDFDDDDAGHEEGDGGEEEEEHEDVDA